MSHLNDGAFAKWILNFEHKQLFLQFQKKTHKKKFNFKLVK